MSLNIYLEFTPNPNTLKFVIEKVLLEKGAANFPDAPSAAGSPLAQKLFGLQGITGVMIGRNFLTITKNDHSEWDDIHQNSMDIIRSHLENGEPIVIGEAVSGPANHESATGEVELKIKKILDDEIRPAVAMDGGDITFDKYEAGVVYLYLQGSCSGCPSSTMTLKMGIESRLKELIPEIKDVVAI